MADEFMSRTCPACGDPGDAAAGAGQPGSAMGPCARCGLPALTFPAQHPNPVFRPTVVAISREPSAPAPRARGRARS